MKVSFIQLSELTELTKLGTDNNLMASRAKKASRHAATLPSGRTSRSYRKDLVVETWCVRTVPCTPCIDAHHYSVPEQLLPVSCPGRVRPGAGCRAR